MKIHLKNISISAATLALSLLTFLPSQASASSSIIVYALNPEGVELPSITSDGVIVGIGSLVVSASADPRSNPVGPIDPGTYQIEALFNGILLKKIVTLKDQEIKEVSFLFPRIEKNISFNFSNSLSLPPGTSSGASE